MTLRSRYRLTLPDSTKGEPCIPRVTEDTPLGSDDDYDIAESDRDPRRHYLHT